MGLLKTYFVLWKPKPLSFKIYLNKKLQTHNETNLRAKLSVLLNWHWLLSVHEKHVFFTVVLLDYTALGRSRLPRPPTAANCRFSWGPFYFWQTHCIAGYWHSDKVKHCKSISFATITYFLLRIGHALHMYFREFYDLLNFYNLLLRFCLETQR